MFKLNRKAHSPSHATTVPPRSENGANANLSKQ